MSRLGATLPKFPVLLMTNHRFPETNAIQRPSGDQAGECSSKAPAILVTDPLPSEARL